MVPLFWGHCCNMKAPWVLWQGATPHSSHSLPFVWAVLVGTLPHWRWEWTSYNLQFLHSFFAVCFWGVYQCHHHWSEHFISTPNSRSLSQVLPKNHQIYIFILRPYHKLLRYKWYDHPLYCINLSSSVLYKQRIGRRKPPSCRFAISSQDVMEMMADLKRTSRVAVLQGWSFLGMRWDHIFMRIYCIHSKWVNQGKSMNILFVKKGRLRSWVWIPELGIFVVVRFWFNFH